MALKLKEIDDHFDKNKSQEPKRDLTHPCEANYENVVASQRSETQIIPPTILIKTTFVAPVCYF